MAVRALVLFSLLGRVAALATLRAPVVARSPAVRLPALQPACSQAAGLPCPSRHAGVVMYGQRGGGDPRGLIGPAIFVFLIATGGFGWVFNILNGLFLLTFLLPLVLTPLFNWYVESNLLQGT